MVKVPVVNIRPQSIRPVKVGVRVQVRVMRVSMRVRGVLHETRGRLRVVDLGAVTDHVGTWSVVVLVHVPAWIVFVHWLGGRAHVSSDHCPPLTVAATRLSILVLHYPGVAIAMSVGGIRGVGVYLRLVVMMVVEARVVGLRVLGVESHHVAAQVALKYPTPT